MASRSSGGGLAARRASGLASVSRSLKGATSETQTQWVSEFWDEGALPVVVLGPVESWALRRLASRCFCVA